MSFKELMTRYKNGTVTDEEKKLVENELEKHEAIEAFYIDQLPENFTDSDSDEEVSQIEEEEILSIRKVVNRKLARVVGLSVLIVILLYIGIFYGLSAVIDQQYYDPSQETSYEGQEHPVADFQLEMQAHVSLNMPGYALGSFTSQDGQGFGVYELSYPLRNLFTHTTQRHLLTLERGNFTHAIDGIFGTENRMNIWNGFEAVTTIYADESEESEETLAFREELTERQNAITLEYLEELNPLSYLSMTIVFEDDLTMDEFSEMHWEHDELDFKWVGVRTNEPGESWRENYYQHLIGFNPTYQDESTGNMRPDPEQYPLFNLNEYHDLLPSSVDSFPEAYETHVTSRVAFLRDREDFVEVVDFSSEKVDFYQIALDYFEENGVNTYGVRVHAAAEDFLDHIENLPYATLYINDVAASRPDIYR